LNLYSNFTYNLARANDQFSQTDQRSVWGVQASRSWLGQFGEDRSLQNTLGLQLRQDRVRLGLFNTVLREVQDVVRDDDVQQTLIGVYAENEIGWTPWLRTVAGWRCDQLSTHVISHVQAQNSGAARASLVSPKRRNSFSTRGADFTATMHEAPPPESILGQDSSLKPYLPWWHHVDRRSDSSRRSFRLG
jgi:TonB dependent receptor